MNSILVAVHVGRPQVLNDPEPWITSIFKNAVHEPVMLGLENLDGNEQADLRFHGGDDKAVCVYASSHYKVWPCECDFKNMRPGGFGENFTIGGCDENSVCIGDTYQIGEAIVQVSQPRGPCWKLARRWGKPELPKLVLASGRTGWYLRVVKEGPVQVGQPLVLLERPQPSLTIALVNKLSYGRNVERKEEILQLAACPELARSWRLSLARRGLEGRPR